VRDLKTFLVSDHPKPANARLNFDETIHVPQFLDFLAQNLPRPILSQRSCSSAASVSDAKEPVFSMIDGYFPSDGHLLGTREKSVFGSDGSASPPLMVHWVYFTDPWLSDLHREKVTRFWTLYFARRGSQLSRSRAICPPSFRRFVTRAVSPQVSPVSILLIPSKRKSRCSASAAMWM